MDTDLKNFVNREDETKLFEQWINGKLKRPNGETDDRPFLQFYGISGIGKTSRKT